MKELRNFTISDTATILQAIERIQNNDSRAVFLVRGKKVVGVVSEGDVVRGLLRGSSVHAPVTTIGHSSFKFLKTKDDAEAFDMFRKFLFSMIPVVDDSFNLVDVITLKDILEKCSLK